MNICLCPKEGQLHEYLLGQLDLSQSEVVDAHLEECPACLCTVAGLDETANAVFARLRQPATPSPILEDPAYQNLVKQVKFLGNPNVPDIGLAHTVPGMVLGNYELLEPIGAGGMGQVFKARHQRMKRIVAMKVLSPDLIRSPAARARFQREVETIARLSSPHIVAAYDAGEYLDRDFLVMEYVAGCNLAELVKKEGPQPVDRAVDYVLQAARGLADAHAAGIIHRDIKPANLLVSGGVVKVLDLGLARVFAEDKKSDLTTGRVVMGTASYMAPEQGVNTHQVDERADIYSLGCCLYYLLTGKPLFDAATDMEILLAHRAQPIPSLCKLRPDCPPAVDALLRRMVAKRPHHRPASMPAVIAELERLQSPRAVRPRRPWLLVGAVALAASVLLALLLPHVGGDLPEPKTGLHVGGDLPEPKTGLHAGGNLPETKNGLHVVRPGNSTPKKPILAPKKNRKVPGNKTSTQTVGVPVEIRKAPVIEMVSIPAGEFWRGSPDSDQDAAANEKPRRKIKITLPFLLAKTKITQAQYEQVMGKNPSAFRAGGKFRKRVKDQDTGRHPVESISWLDAIHFCNRLSERHGLEPYYQIDRANVTVRGGTGYRLPTEAEWEYACRGGTTSPWYFGESPAAIDLHAWYAGNSKDSTHPVGLKKANPFRLYDMHGNVSEWCWDRFNPDYYQRASLSDPPGPGVGRTRVYRGGGWNDAAAQTRAAARNSLGTSYAVLTVVGVRVARNLP